MNIPRALDLPVGDPAYVVKTAWQDLAMARSYLRRGNVKPAVQLMGRVCELLEWVVARRKP